MVCLFHDWVSKVMDHATLSQHPGWIVASLCAIFLSGILRGFSGFGASLFSVSILSLIFAPSDVAPIMMGVQILSGLQTFFSDRHFIHWPCVTPLAIASVVTAMVGVVALVTVDTDQARLGMSLIVTAAVVVLISGWRYQSTPRLEVSLGVGAISGLLNGFAAMGGPPLIAFFLGGPFMPATSRSSMTFLFMLQGAASLICIAVLGGLGVDALLTIIAVFPLMAAGTVVGTSLFRAIGSTHYRFVSISVLGVLAVSLAVRAVWPG